jgi:hypothetical protein
MPRVHEDDLVCPTCGDTRAVPACCGKTMEFDGSAFYCSTCEKEVKLPACCGAGMRLRRKVRDIRKEIFRSL